MDSRIRRTATSSRRSALGAPKVTLERVIGLTSNINAQITLDTNSGTIAYAAGCVAVLHGRHSQDNIINTSRKTISALTYSNDGKYLALGETVVDSEVRSGHRPAVKVYEVESKLQISEMHGHKFGVNCVVFSPNGKYLVSIGVQHDMVINVWNWKHGNIITANRISSKVNALAFSTNGNTFVTAGVRHVKYWFLDESKRKTTVQSRNETIPLLGRNALLSEHKNNTFVDVSYGTGTLSECLYVITQQGLLCQLTDRQISLTIQLKTIRAYCLKVGERDVIVGCADGVIRIFDAETLQHRQTLPKPHPLGVDVITGAMGVAWAHDCKYPDTLGLVFDERGGTLTCVYSDHSLYTWDISQLPRVGKLSSQLYHSSCVWDIAVLPEGDENSLLPVDTFITSSSDDTIRFWNMNPHSFINMHERKPTFNHELLSIVYTDASLGSLCEVEYTADKPDIYDSRNGVRCLVSSPDGRHLASGDLVGNVRIHSLKDFSEIQVIEAHDSSVLALEYSDQSRGYYFLASASRDRLIHLYDPANDYQHLQTLSDHSSSVCSVKFIPTIDELIVLSCSSDKSLLFRVTCIDEDDNISFQLKQNLVSKSTPNDMVVDRRGNVATACQDRMIRLYNTNTAKQRKNYKGSLSEDGNLTKLTIDPSSTYIAAGCSDKSISIVDYLTGEIVATMTGHSEVITGLKFLNNLSHLLTASADGCIFIWKLDPRLTEKMINKKKGLNSRLNNRPDVILVEPLSPGSSLSPRAPSTASSGASNEIEDAFIVKPSKLLSDRHNLPPWACQVSNDNDNFNGSVTRGRWDTDKAIPVMTSVKNGQVYMSPDSQKIASNNANIIPIAVQNRSFIGDDPEVEGHEELTDDDPDLDVLALEDGDDDLVPNASIPSLRTLQSSDTVYYDCENDDDLFSVERLARRREDERSSTTSDPQSLLTFESEDDLVNTPRSTPLDTPATSVPSTPASPTKNIVEILQQITANQKADEPIRQSEVVEALSSFIEKSTSDSGQGDSQTPPTAPTAQAAPAATHGILKKSSLKNNLENTQKRRVVVRSHTSPSSTPGRESLGRHSSRDLPSPYSSSESLTSAGSETVNSRPGQGRKLPQINHENNDKEAVNGHEERSFSEIDEACTGLRSSLFRVMEIYSEIQTNSNTETDFLVETLKDVRDVIDRAIPPKSDHVQIHTDVVARLQWHLQDSLNAVRTLVGEAVTSKTNGDGCQV